MAWNMNERTNTEPVSEGGQGRSRSSFLDYAAAVAPEALPRFRPGAAETLSPHGTTIVTAIFGDGVLMAADRRATVGNVIAQRDIQKVFAADDYSLIGIAGAAGIAVEIARLFQVELEHYEKIEGSPLSLDGKGNRLGAMIRQNLDLAMQGFVALPILAGFDSTRGRGRLFSFDPTGGRYEETGFHSVGSGAVFARGALKKLYRDDMNETDGVVMLLQALIDSADDDSATAGPDMYRRIFPSVMSATAEGARRWTDDDLSPLVDSILQRRHVRPDGPEAPLL